MWEALCHMLRLYAVRGGGGVVPVCQPATVLEYRVSGIPHRHLRIGFIYGHVCHSTAALTITTCSFPLPPHGVISWCYIRMLYSGVFVIIRVSFGALPSPILAHPPTP